MSYLPKKLYKSTKKILLIVGACIVVGANIALITDQKIAELSVAEDSIWLKLMKIRWVEKYNKKYKTKMLYPKFSKATEALNGKTIIIEGHLIPTEMYAGGGEFVVISALPFKSCYFCGGAGPESVMEVHLKRKRTTFHATKITFKGRLELNHDDPDHLIYILKDAVQVIK